MLIDSTMLAAGNLIDHVLPQKLSLPGFLSSVEEYALHNHMLMSVVAGLLVILVFRHVAGRVKVTGDKVDDYVTKGRVAQVFEVMCLFMRDKITRPALGDLTDKYIYYVWTVFFLVLFMNLLGLIPSGPLLALMAHYTTDMSDYDVYRLSYYGGTATGNLSVTAALATTSLFMIFFVGIRHQGLHYFAHFNPGPWWMAPILVPLELMGLLVKVLVLACRLFGNMLVGHLVIAALIALIFQYGSSLIQGVSVGIAVAIGAAVITMLEIFIGFLQAFIFTFLTVLFISAGVAHHGDDHAHDDEHDHAADTHHEPETSTVPGTA